MQKNCSDCCTNARMIVRTDLQDPNSRGRGEQKNQVREGLPGITACPDRDCIVWRDSPVLLRSEASRHLRLLRIITIDDVLSKNIEY